MVPSNFGVLMPGFTGFSIMLFHNGYSPSLWRVGFYTPLLIAMYGIAMRNVFRYERTHVALLLITLPTSGLT
jgi:cation:H+ antiporter